MCDSVVMFLRRCHRRKNGKQHIYWTLVESIRTAAGSRQRVVAYLGELTGGEQSGWAQLSKHLQKPQRPHPSLFDPPHYDNPDGDEKILVKLEDITFERLRDFGDVWLAYGLWRLLGLDTALTECMPSGREAIPWPVVAQILAIARFCEPSSELHIEDHWYGKTALEDLLGVSQEAIHTDRLYAAMDHILPCKDTVEKHLKGRLGELFDIKYDLLLYDVTSTYFEGQCKGNSLAKRGYSRDSRPDCLQVCIGLVVTDEGMPIGYEVFAGNTHDSKTVEQIVTSMEVKYGRANRIWVMDRGMVSENNLTFIRQRKGSYIVGTPKSMLKQFEQYLTDKDWHEVGAGVEVKLVTGDDSNETFILARSKDRQEKERAIHERFIERMEAALDKLKASIDSGRLKDLADAHRRLGRLQQRYWRAASAFEIRIAPIQNPVRKNRLTIEWNRNQKWSQWAALSEGCYILRTNLVETDPAILWKRYIQLTEAEWAFRIAKDELSIRPIWHHKAHRVEAHILVCFLAYVMWKTLGQWMKRSGLGDAPRTLLQEFAKIKSGDVVLPARTADGRISKLIRLRCVTSPDEAQKVLLSRLGLTVPRRLRRLEKITKCSEDF
jgi:transposase